MIDRGRGVMTWLARDVRATSPRARSTRPTTMTTTVRAVGNARAMSTSVSSRRAVETVIRRATANGDEAERERERGETGPVRVRGASSRRTG